MAFLTASSSRRDEVFERDRIEETAKLIERSY